MYRWRHSVHWTIFNIFFTFACIPLHTTRSFYFEGFLTRSSRANEAFFACYPFTAFDQPLISLSHLINLLSHLTSLSYSTLCKMYAKQCQYDEQFCQPEKGARPARKSRISETSSKFGTRDGYLQPPKTDQTWKSGNTAKSKSAEPIEESVTKNTMKKNTKR